MMVGRIDVCRVFVLLPTYVFGHVRLRTTFLGKDTLRWRFDDLRGRNLLVTRRRIILVFFGLSGERRVL